jgi:hypothetical protein
LQYRYGDGSATGSLSTIGRQFGMSADGLCRLNGMKQCECLPEGRGMFSLKIPVNPTAPEYRRLLMLEGGTSFVVGQTNVIIN